MSDTESDDRGPDDTDLLAAQEGKGYGEDEGERDDSLEDGAREEGAREEDDEQ